LDDVTIGETVFTYVDVGKLFKNFLKDHRTKRAEIYMKVFRCSTKAVLLNSWSLEVGLDHNRGNWFYMCLY
jgi:hypothetical protein